MDKARINIAFIEEQKKLITFFAKNKDIIKPSGIEKRAKVPASTLTNFLNPNKDKGISPANLARIIKVIKGSSYQYKPKSSAKMLKEFENVKRWTKPTSPN